MFQQWRLKLREAEEALKAGRLEEARRVLSDPQLADFFPARKLLAEVAARLMARGEAEAARGESAAGWRDLEQAAEVGADHQRAAALRRQLAQHWLEEAEKYLESDDVASCLARLKSLRRRADSRQARQLEHVAQKVAGADRLARQGKFAEAERALAAAAALRPDLKLLAERRARYERQGAESRLLGEELHRALTDEDWSRVLSVADRLLELAPESAIALAARRRAWGVAGAAVSEPRPRPVSPLVPRPVKFSAAQPMPGEFLSPSPLSPAPPSAAGRRFLLWVDGVGGYLVCEGEDVVLGQPGGGERIDVPILGDVSRQHARIVRSGEGYLITPLRTTSVNGRRVDGTTSLADGALIELGEGVRLRFRRPHPLSATARLEFASHHRTQPSCDAVLLMADSLILGPAPNSHVVCPGWSRQVVLCQGGELLGCRAPGWFQVDGQTFESEASLTRDARLAGDDFSLSLEEL